jgi:hypothetical protein
MKLLVFVIVVGTFLFQCGNKKVGENGSIKDEDYKTFIRHFNKDTLFQKSRVKFKSKNKFIVTIINIDTTLFRITTVTDNLIVTESVTYKKDTSYWIKFIFKKEEGKWYCVDYLDSYDD